MSDRRWIGRRTLTFKSVTSTNDLAREWNEPGLAIVAEHQTYGRGQHERTWQSRPGDSLLLSVTLAPPPDLTRPVILTAWAAVAVAEAVHELTQQQAKIKWPNDLLLKDRKICGILTELHRSAIVGIGLNLNQSAADFEAIRLEAAGSLFTVSGRTFASKDVLEVVLRKLDEKYDRLVHGDWTTVEENWKSRIGLLGRDVQVDLAEGNSLAGNLAGLSFDRLELECNNGPHTLIPERVRHLSPV